MMLGDSIDADNGGVTKEQIDKMAHAIGWGNEDQVWTNYRNWYGTQDGDPDFEDLVSRGLAEKGSMSDSYRYYRVTDAGRAVVRKHRPKLQAWRVEIDGYAVTILAKSRAKAKYSRAIGLSDCCQEPLFTMMRRMKATKE